MRRVEGLRLLSDPTISLFFFTGLVGEAIRYQQVYVPRLSHGSRFAVFI